MKVVFQPCLGSFSDSKINGSFVRSARTLSACPSKYEDDNNWIVPSHFTIPKTDGKVPGFPFCMMYLHHPYNRSLQGKFLLFTFVIENFAVDLALRWAVLHLSVDFFFLKITIGIPLYIEILPIIAYKT